MKLLAIPDIQSFFQVTNIQIVTYQEVLLKIKLLSILKRKKALKSNALGNEDGLIYII